MDQSSVVLVTGALTGIGRATAVAFDRAAIVVSGRHDGIGQALARELGEAGAKAAFIRADVRFDDQVAALADQTVERFGRLDILDGR